VGIKGNIKVHSPFAVAVAFAFACAFIEFRDCAVYWAYFVIAFSKLLQLPPPLPASQADTTVPPFTQTTWLAKYTPAWSQIDWPSDNRQGTETAGPEKTSLGLSRWWRFRTGPLGGGGGFGFGFCGTTGLLRLLCRLARWRTLRLSAVGRGPECQVVPEELHDESAVAVRLLRKGVKLGDGVIESLLGEMASPVRRVQDLVIEDGEVEGETETDGVSWSELGLSNVRCVLTVDISLLFQFFHVIKNRSPCMPRERQSQLFCASHLTRTPRGNDGNLPSCITKFISVKCKRRPRRSFCIADECTYILW